jgi:hypothetical protein
MDVNMSSCTLEDQLEEFKFELDTKFRQLDISQ